MRRVSRYVLRYSTRLAILAALVWLAACNSVPSDPIVGQPTIVGNITRIEAVQNGLRILVEENIEVQTPIEPGGRKIWFTVDERTTVFDARGAAVTRASAQDLRLGLRVEALADGLIADSYPSQALAKTIVILE